MALGALARQIAEDDQIGPQVLDDFNEADLVWVRQLLRSITEDWYLTNLDLFDGEHFSPGGPDHEGEGWVGPRPEPSDPLYTEVMDKIKQIFVSSNKVREVTERKTDGVVGREPDWGFTVTRPLADGETPNEVEQALIDEAEALLVEWWDDRKVLEVIQKAANIGSLCDRAAVRFFLPRSRMIGGTFPDMQTALRALFIMSCGPEQATVYIDPDTMEELGVYMYSVRGEERAEITWVQDEQTIFRIVGDEKLQMPEEGAVMVEQQASPTGLGAWQFDYGGHIPIFEMTGVLLITEQVRKNQYLLNKALTMMSRNLDQGGFLERVVLNGQMPGHYEEDEDAPSGRVWIPDPYRMGAGLTTYIAGLEQTDAETGQTTYTTPSLMYRDPVSVTSFTDSRQEAYLAILEEVQQLHVAIAGDATPSGESRRQAMAAYITSLRKFKTKVDRLIRWILETAIDMAAYWSGQPGRYKTLRAFSEARLDPGPVPSDEILAITGRYQAGLLSQPTAMSLQGIEDPDAEIALINASTQADLTFGAADGLNANDLPDQQTGDQQPPTDPNVQDNNTQDPNGPGVLPTGNAA